MGNVSYKDNMRLLEPEKNSFINNIGGVESNAVAQGWMFKLGAAISGLEQNYWKKRWVSLYKKPPRLAYAQHPYSTNDEPETLKINEQKEEKKELEVPIKTRKRKKSGSINLKGVINL